MADDRVDRIDGERAGGKSRTQRLMDLFQRNEQAEEADPFKSFASHAQTLSKAKASAWSQKDVTQLSRLATQALNQTEKQAGDGDPNNPYAQQQLVENTRAQLRQMALALQPPGEVVESPEFQALMESLNPQGGKRNKDDFSNKTLMHGRVRGDVLNRQVSEAVTGADKNATAKRIARMQKAGADAAAVQGASASLMNLARALRKKKKKKKAEASDAVDETTEPEYELTIEDAEELAGKAIEVMKNLREDVAPRWAPNQQPWFLNAADNEVFNIVLAAIPKELFEETQGFQEIQDLRAGQGVFTLRAADRTNEAIKRK